MTQSGARELSRATRATTQQAAESNSRAGQGTSDAARLPTPVTQCLHTGICRMQGSSMHPPQAAQRTSRVRRRRRSPGAPRWRAWQAAGRRCRPRRRKPCQWRCCRSVGRDHILRLCEEKLAITTEEGPNSAHASAMQRPPAGTHGGATYGVAPQLAGHQLQPDAMCCPPHSPTAGCRTGHEARAWRACAGPTAPPAGPKSAWPKGVEAARHLGHQCSGKAWPPCTQCRLVAGQGAARHSRGVTTPRHRLDAGACMSKTPIGLEAAAHLAHDLRHAQRLVHVVVRNARAAAASAVQCWQHHRSEGGSADTRFALRQPPTGDKPALQ